MKGNKPKPVFPNSFVGNLDGDLEQKPRIIIITII